MNKPPTQRYGTICSAVASLIAVTACGGGGGRTTASAEPLEAQRSTNQSVGVVEFGAAAALAQAAAPAAAPAMASVSDTAGTVAVDADVAKDLPPAPAVVHAKPRTALTLLGINPSTAQIRTLIARYQFAILGQWPGLGATNLQANITNIKALNPNIKLAQYAMLQEMQDLGATDPSFSIFQAVQTNNWWHRDAVGNRTKVSTFPSYNINITSWAPPDASGQRWHQVKAKFDNDKLFANMKGLDYVYMDGFDVPLSDGDWKRIGTNQSRTDPVVVSAYRNGNVNYASSVRLLNPGLKFMGNSASIEAPEYKNQLEGVYRECLIGKSWSIETRLGWDAMMNSYRLALANAKAPKDVVFGACSTTADAAMYRYGLASTLLENGYFSFSQNGYQSYPWFDESDAPLGTAAEAPPTAPTVSGIWMRKYTNGLVLVNPSKTTAASANVGAGYKYVNGTIDPVVNNGLPVSNNIVTLQPRSGLVLVRD
jgi:hypothetical protein